MIIKEIVFKSTQFFKNKGIESARLDAELIIGHVLKRKRIELYTDFEYPLDESEIDSCRKLVKERATGRPVAQIIGYKDFYKNRFTVNEHVLTPRSETELIVEKVVDHFKDHSLPLEGVDLGCGSGCIGLSLVEELDHQNIHLVDISPEALEVAQLNAQNLGLSNITWHNLSTTDLSEKNIGLGKMDYVVANPPYVDKKSFDYDELSLSFEPSVALFSGDNGIHDLQCWAKVAYELLKSSGIYVFELGYDQMESMKSHCQSEVGFSEVYGFKDYSGFDRIVLAVK